MDSILLFSGSGVLIVWGIGHIVPVRNIIQGFGKLNKDNTLILLMEWVAEGLFLVFLGVLPLLVILVFSIVNPVSVFVIRVCAGMVIIMAIWSLFTGARTTILPMKLCPAIKTLSAALMITGTIL